jgi:hypothetical protein
MIVAVDASIRATGASRAGNTIVVIDEEVIIIVTTPYSKSGIRSSSKTKGRRKKAGRTANLSA